MDLETFRDLLDMRGADLAAWTAADRQDACALLERSAEARAALGEATRIEALLARSMAADRASGALKCRLLAIPGDHPRPVAAGRSRWARRFPMPWRIGMASAAASLLFGIYAGANGALPIENADPVAAEIIDVVDIAFGSDLDEGFLP